MKRLEAIFKLDAKDWLAAEENYRKTSETFKRNMKIEYWVFTIIIFLIMIWDKKDIPNAYFNDLFPTYSKLGFFMFHFIAWHFLIYPILGPKAYYLGNLLKINHLKEKDSFFGQRKMKIDDSGLAIELPDSTTIHYKWDKFIRVSEDDFRYYLYLTDVRMTIIKKTAENLTDQEQNEMNALIKKYTQSLIVQESNEKKDFTIWYKMRPILLTLYLLIFIQNYFDWGISADEAEKVAYALFKKTDELDNRLFIREDLTQKDIDYAWELLSYVEEFHEKYEFTWSRSNGSTRAYFISNLISTAQNQFNKRQKEKFFK